eukprot:32155-Ditylum_brightwellii.AAC.1
MQYFCNNFKKDTIHYQSSTKHKEYGRGIWERNTEEEYIRRIRKRNTKEEYRRGIWKRNMEEEYGRGIQEKKVILCISNIKGH